jgi:hypothetical protein
LSTSPLHKEVALYPWQYLALKEFQPRQLADGQQQRFFGAFCGTGAGKSFFGAVWALDQHIRIARRLAGSRSPLGLIIAPTYRHLDRHAVGNLENLVRGTTHQGTYRMGHGEYAFSAAAGGGKAYCGSADHPTSLEGAHVDWVWIDEAGLTKDLLWDILRARTQITQAPILVTSYWYSLQWCFTRLWQPFEQGDQSVKLLCFPSTANPNIDPAEFARIRDSMDARLFQMRHEGRPSQMVGLVYGAVWSGCQCDPFPLPKDWQLTIGCDQGYSPAPFHALLHAQDPDAEDETGYVVAEFVDRASTTAAKAKALTAWVRRFAPWVSDVHIRLYGDPSNKQGLADLRHEMSKQENPLNISVLPAQNAVDAGIEAVYSLLVLGKLKVMRGRCPELSREMDLYHRDDLGNIVKQNDHGPDALRYLVYSRARRGQSIGVSSMSWT